MKIKLIINNIHIQNLLDMLFRSTVFIKQYILSQYKKNMSTQNSHNIAPSINVVCSGNNECQQLSQD